MKNSETIEAFLTLFQEAETRCAFAEELLDQANKKTQDILHYLELENPNYKESAKKATELKRVRKQRRQYKDEVEELADIATFIKENRKVMRDLEQLLGKVRKVEKYHAERRYVPKCKE